MRHGIVANDQIPGSLRERLFHRVACVHPLAAHFIAASTEFTQEQLGIVLRVLHHQDA
jgi:hypothetical protein